ncbi:MAG: hypothetical protein ACFFAN_04465 [Promethearchaeota archaeon]
MIILLIMAFIMFGSSIVILYLGRKHGTPNIILWTLFPLIRGIHWLIEYIADYYDEILDLELPIFDRLELFTAFCSSFLLLAACLEFNGTIRRPFGKITAILAAFTPLYFVVVLKNNTIEEIEDTIFFKGFIVNSDPTRFLYGFIIPFISIIVIISTYFYYRYEVKRGEISHNPKLMRTTLIIAALILLFSVFEGFDYEEIEEYEAIFILFRSITLSFFILLPLIIILSSDMGLQKFLMIEHSGVPVFSYDFKNKSHFTDDTSLLTSGFLSAITTFSERISSNETDFLSIRSHRLYYAILKNDKMIYALQSILYNKILESHFFNTTKKIDKLIAKLNKISATNAAQVKEILDENFSIFY